MAKNKEMGIRQAIQKVLDSNAGRVSITEILAQVKALMPMTPIGMQTLQTNLQNMVAASLINHIGDNDYLKRGVDPSKTFLGALRANGRLSNSPLPIGSYISYRGPAPSQSTAGGL